MYALFITDNGTVTEITGKGLSDIMDKFLVAKRNGVEMASLFNAAGELLRRVENAVKLPALKLTDAMRKALDSAQETGILAEGRANTLKALEDRGLVAIAKSGAAKLTSLGRQYQKKGA